MDGSGAGRSGYDGTQPPPPPRLFPDPLAGLVTGEQPYRPPEPVVPPMVVPPGVVPPAAVEVPPHAGTRAAPGGARPARPTVPQSRTAQGRAAQGRAAQGRSAQDRGTPNRRTQVRSAQVSAPSGWSAPLPAAPGRSGPQVPAQVPRTVGPQPPKKNAAGLVGCLVVLAALGGLLFNVLREIIEAVVDLVR
ncbi:hypothetical protein ACIGNX_17215 [Actinosynnema sp. NPDC053489]|uniref:hypothetical protein n=1 Tax=Actinosynnema sp. NPDC053489 TaxID=3363916 RepID=UPI0037CB9BBE